MFFEKRVHVHYQILNNLEQRQRFNHKIVGGFEIPDQLLAGQLYPAIDHQGVRTADPMGTGIAIAQGGVLFPADLVQTVQDFVCGLCLDHVFLIPGLFIHRRVETVDDKGAFHLSISFL